MTLSFNEDDPDILLKVNLLRAYVVVVLKVPLADDIDVPPEKEAKFVGFCKKLGMTIT